MSDDSCSGRRLCLRWRIDIAYEQGIRPLDSRKYVDSERFTENMYETSQTILEALGETEILNESSKEDLVDLTELKEGKSLSNKNTSGLAYKAG